MVRSIMKTGQCLSSLSADKTDLPRLRALANTFRAVSDGFYIAVREALKTGKPVLVCGGPCQMATLRGFLHKTYDNLILVDYICRGIPLAIAFPEVHRISGKQASFKGCLF